ncbi:polyprenyl synthetase family protein [Streptomyces spectabilis]|uniref:Geranylgeranyl diphosphate synthase type I n=1 Tax=Streptomyces spectabilis TaxID=68270 RepID=A0A7W8B4A2_STRST|nr:polyprenyl synthetase family protein [Streptomyces spectabilis]MBB5110071.1 geranylgeranyl diphosphate synthase type I [Streptomyces spectabilis]GGV58125.1 geranylgeranyl pyrophosphate synthase [Streptomyces spectabilis]
MTVRVAELPDAAALRGQVVSCLDGFLDRKARTAAGLGLPAEVPRLLRDFLASGGKRLRPLLCITGWQAASGHGALEPVVRTAASLEMFHAFCLIHDDIMDNSDTRRGAPTLHRRLTRHHQDGRSTAAARHLGASTAVLVGDLALAWSDELLHTAGHTLRQLAAVLPLVDVMRSEVMYGQYLDVTAANRPTTDVERALQIVRYKTAKYTVERPLHIGAALASPSPAMCEALSAYALPLGEAFQLRDDLLGVFGTPEVTGKPSLDDLREGKHTVLAALALGRADAGQRHTLATLLGDPGLDDTGADRIRRVLTATGARESVERMISTRHAQALDALQAASLPAAATGTLRQLADAATARTS